MMILILVIFVLIIFLVIRLTKKRQHESGYLGTRWISISRRRIGTSIVFSFLTFGIYAIYWEYQLIKNTKAIKNDPSGCVGEMLCLIFVPFYHIYWWYTRGKGMKDEFAKQGYSANGNEMAYLILGICGLRLVSMAIMQDDFNMYVLKGAKNVVNHPEPTAYTNGVCEFCGQYKPVRERIWEEYSRNLCDDCYKNWKAQIDNKAVL
ncbi:MAG: DUF4234 domain-containing protein [Clostridia bacterium]|nr:DUF4234 domain-containing protein [Clostridia bacterium]